MDIAINHDPAAIAMHRANHPATKHYTEDVWKVDPKEACAGRPVALCWFSPDCKHHSKAKGGKPVSRKIRGLAWVAVKWAKAVRPRVLELAEADEADICWLEGKSVQRIIPCRVHCYPDTARIFKLIANKEDLALDEYGMAWRCWSARPTKAQRKEAAWNDG